MNKKIIILTIVLFLLTGCTKRFNVTDAETEKQKSYTANILCQPTTEEMRNIYLTNEEETGIILDELPTCKEFNAFKKSSGGQYEGIWTSVFVKPLSFVIIRLGNLVGNHGISIMIIGFLLRAAMFPLSKKSTNMNENMQKAKGDLSKLEKKYKNRTDKESMMVKSQEMMLIYKKYNISPLSGCLFAFLQLPIFFAFLEAVQRIPVFFEQNLWKFHLGTTPYEGIFDQQNYWYIILIVLILAATYFSFKNMNTASMDESQAKQMAVMNKIMVCVISVVSFTLPTAIALYWIVSNGFTVIQNLLLKRGKKHGEV